MPHPILYFILQSAADIYVCVPSHTHAQGKSQKEIDDWNVLVTEVCQAINSKQLVPTLRTQYMRTAFQIPFDATVRISLDSNLCMLTETGRLGNQDRWFRDPSKPVPRNEITRFPHAVLEVKLQLTVSLVVCAVHKSIYHHARMAD